MSKIKKNQATTNPIAKIAVLGAGSWGTALALLLARNGCEVWLWGHRADHMAELDQHRVNQRYLPGFSFPEHLKVSSNLAEVVDACDECLISVPSHAFILLLQQLAVQKASFSRLTIATKGLVDEPAQFLTQAVARYYPAARSLLILSGPSFAREVAEGLPTAITLAGDDHTAVTEVAKLFHNRYFRVYPSHDLIGVQLGGVVKNVMAVATGVCDGMQYGANARAALITRGLAEMTRLAVAVGGQAETCQSLAGIGDLVLTCTDDQSRNRRFGLALGRGATPLQALKAIGQVVEGSHNATQLLQLAKQHQIEMPITEQVANLVNDQISAEQAVENLLSRPSL